MEDMEEKDSWPREQYVQMPHIRGILLEELKESQCDGSKKRENERKAEARSMIMGTMRNVLDFIVRTLGSERVLSKGGGGTVRY